MISDSAKFCNFCGVRTALNIPENSAPISDPVREENDDLSSFMPKPADEIVSISEETVKTENIGENAAENPEDYVNAAEAPENLAEPSVEAADNAETENTQGFSGFEAEYDNAPLPTDLTPNIISTEGIAPVGMDFSAPVVPVNSKEPAERKYTLGHIMMCLAAVAVMAIVAGVFAGLYFSVV